MRILRVHVDRSGTHRYHRRVGICYLLRSYLKCVRQWVLAMAHSRVVVLRDGVSRVAVHHVAELVEFWLFLQLVPRLFMVISVAEAKK